MAARAHTIDGDRLERARTQLELTQAALADRAGIHRVTLTRIENGAGCSLDTVERLATELGVQREWLLGMPDEAAVA